jgi:hypothetical protein
LGVIDFEERKKRIPMVNGGSFLSKLAFLKRQFGQQKAF